MLIHKVDTNRHEMIIVTHKVDTEMILIRNGIAWYMLKLVTISLNVLNDIAQS